MPVHILGKYLLHPCRGRHREKEIYNCMAYFVRQNAVCCVLERKVYSPCFVVIERYGRLAEAAYSEIFQRQIFICKIDVELKMEIRRIHVQNLLNPLHDGVNPVLRYTSILHIKICL